MMGIFPNVASRVFWEIPYGLLFFFGLYWLNLSEMIRLQGLLHIHDIGRFTSSSHYDAND